MECLKAKKFSIFIPKPKYLVSETLLWCFMGVAVQMPHAPVLFCGLGPSWTSLPRMHLGQVTAMMPCLEGRLWCIMGDVIQAGCPVSRGDSHEDGDGVSELNILVITFFLPKTSKFSMEEKPIFQPALIFVHLLSFFSLNTVLLLPVMALACLLLVSTESFSLGVAVRLE